MPVAQLVRDERTKRDRPRSETQEPGEPSGLLQSAPVDVSAWQWLGRFGAAFLLIGAVDFSLAWVPFAFGSADWEFGTITAVLNSAPVPALGIGLILASAHGEANRRMLRAASVVSLLAATLLAGAGLLYLLVIPVALQLVTNPLPRVGVQKAILKTVVALLVYIAIFAWAGVATHRRLAPPARKA